MEILRTKIYIPREKAVTNLRNVKWQPGSEWYKAATAARRLKETILHSRRVASVRFHGGNPFFWD